MSTLPEKTFRIGIIGGMGPLAGVYLQKLIIEATPVTKDQDHLQVVCFTNPQIPDRTASLRENNGSAFVKELLETGKLLSETGVDVIVIPCNTAHAKLSEIQEGLSVPVFDMVEAVADKIKKTFRKKKVKIGLLATDGTIFSRVYHRALKGIPVITLSSSDQQKLMRIIYAIKKGNSVKKIEKELQAIINRLLKNGAGAVILGCTELSTYFEVLEPKAVLIDPLRVSARKLAAVKN